jgi:hypothetical protein
MANSSGSSNPVSNHDWTIHSLNIHGTFFERWCEYVIDRHPKWRVSVRQYPVAFSPTSGPLHKTSGHESALDIRAELEFGDGRVLNLLIECKKNNPEFIDWIFFSLKRQRTLSVFIAPAVLCPTPTDKASRPVLRPMLRELYFEVPIAEDGRETRGDYHETKNDRIKTKTANDSISAAAHQVALATQAIFLEEASNNLPEIPIKGAMRIRSEKQIFIPVIVTTARLQLCEFDPAAISASAGTIPYDQVKLTEMPYLIYQYALPVHLQMDKGHILFLSSQQQVAFLNRMHIFVVNSAHFEQFLNMLRQNYSELFFQLTASLTE